MGATPGPTTTAPAQASNKPAVPVVSEAPAEKKKYTLDELKALGATPSPIVPETEDGLLKTIAKGIVKPVATMVARPIQAIAALGGADADTIDAATKKVAGDWVAPTPRSGTDVLKDVGRGIETVALGAGTGGLKAGQTVLGKTVPKAFQTPGAIELAKSGAVKLGLKEGTKYGAIGGFGAGLEDDPTNLGTVAGKTAFGAVLGGATGAAIPAVSKAFGKTAPQQAAKAEEAAMVAEKAPDARVATKMANEAGKVVDDPIAREAVKQGLPEGKVAVIKSASPEDKVKMKKMLEIRKKGISNERFGASNRATDVSGETGMNLARHIEKVNREAGEKLNSVAKALAGRKADPSKALTQFGEAMDGHGITIKKGGQLNFKGSDFEGVPSTQRLITNIWDRTMRAVKTGDAYQLHRLKTFIDENVSHGKQVEGLSGKAERLVKGLRRGIDEALDSKFPTYNKVNTQFSDTINEMNKLADYLGVDFKMGKEFANMKMGTALRRLMGNSQNRAAMHQALESAQAVAKKYGYKGKDDIVNQALFADILDDLFGAEAKTSLQGDVEAAFGAASELGSAASDVVKGGTGFISGPLKATKFIYDKTRGISQENKIKALEALLERDIPKKAPSNFGRPIK